MKYRYFSLLFLTLGVVILLAPISQGSDQLTVIQIPEGPSARWNHSTIKDIQHNDMIIFGGVTSYNPSGTLINELWKFNLDTLTWTQISLFGIYPPPVRGHTAVYDPMEARMLVFGGVDWPDVRNDLYELDLNTYTWTLLSTNGTPPSPRWNHVAVYNSQNHSMAIFGGQDGSSLYNDTWVLDLNTMTWSNIPSYGPSPRVGHTAIYYPDNNSMIIFAGWDGDAPFYNDLWEFDFDTQNWTCLSPSGDPPMVRSGPGLAYDDANKRMLVFGGDGTETWEWYGALDDIWELDLVTLTWNRLFPLLARDLLSMVYDESDGSLIIFGGEQRQRILFGDGYRMFIGTPSFLNGDVNCDGEVNAVDAVYLINYLFKNGPEPCLWE